MNDMPVPVGERRPLTPTNLAEAEELAARLAKSEFVPQSFRNRPGDVLAAILLGLELGLPPLTALQSLAVVNGRPTVFGDAALALVFASGLLEDFREEVGADKATCMVKRRGIPTPVERTFSVEDAKRAGLLTKQGPWLQYTRRMLQMRARSWALRDAFPDILRGVALADMPETTTQPRSAIEAVAEIVRQEHPASGETSDD